MLYDDGFEKNPYSIDIEIVVVEVVVDETAAAVAAV